MDKNVLEKLVEQGLSTTKIAKHLQCSQTNVRYWLGKFDLKTNPYFVTNDGFKKCARCNSSKPVEEFYKRRKRSGYLAYCKDCTNEQTIERQRKVKEDAVNYKGGKCQICDYSKYLGALEFHHLNPSEKDFSISNQKSTTMNRVIKKELDKCLLVCSNCHREIHGGVIEIDEVALAQKARENEYKELIIKEKTTVEKYNLCECGNRKQIKSENCSLCRKSKPRESQRRVVRPSKEELERLINEFPFTTLGKKFGVSDNAIKRWCVDAGIVLTSKRGYWSKKRASKE